MDDVRKAIYAVAKSVEKHIKRTSETKYQPLAFKSKDFKDLVANRDYQDVLNDDLPDDQYAAIQERDGKKYLVFDTDNIPRSVLLEHSATFEALHKRCKGFAIEHREGIAKVMNEDDGIVDRVFNRFEDRIPRRLLPVLEEALVLRALEQEQNLHQETVYQWRGEIADKYKENGNDPEEAQNLISLCSAGYLDENDVFDDMYTDMVANGSKTKSEYKSLFNRYVSQNPFVVFVSSYGRSADEVCGKVNDKLSKIHRWEGSPGFVEVCGKGRNSHKVVEDVREKIDFSGEVSSRHNPEIEQLIIRFKPPVSDYVRHN